jgi:hypothetical protein
VPLGTSCVRLSCHRLRGVMSDSYDKGLHSNQPSHDFQTGSQAWEGAMAAERMRWQQAQWDRQQQEQRDDQRRQDDNRRAADARSAEEQRWAEEQRRSQQGFHTTAPSPQSYATQSSAFFPNYRPGTGHQQVGKSSGVNGFKLAALAGIIIMSAIGLHHVMSPTAISSGPAIVDHPAQLNLRNCPAPNCAIIAQLNKGDQVFVAKSYDNGWNAVTVQSGNSASLKGFVNGEFLRGR